MSDELPIIGVIVSAIIGIVGLYVISVMITTLAPTNQLFSQIIFGGILGAIIFAVAFAIKASSR